MSEPFNCPRCGQTGNERPGFKVLPFPEAVGFVEGEGEGGMYLVDSFECNACGYQFVTAKGLIEIRQPE